MSMFQKATKRAVRARIGIDGPSGAGKTYTALEWARVLGKRIAVVDTERGSASLYSDLFDFDVLEVSPPFHPDRFVEAIRDAEKNDYDVVILDSLSHAWEGEGGVLDIVDAAAARQNGNSYTAWKSGTPILRHLIDTILATDIHVIVTMRSKTEYVLEENDRGKKQPRKVGMAPVMRAGMEYELTLVGDMDLEHRMTITKSRCPALSDLVVQPGRASEAAETFVSWTQSGAGMASRTEIDALKQMFNDIEPKDARTAAKRAFADQFGNPDYMLADKLSEAIAFVEGFSGKVSQPDAGGAGVETGRDSGGRAGVTSPPPATAKTADKPPTGRQLHALAHVKANPDDDKDRPLTADQFDLIVFNCTGGRTDSAVALSDTEANAVDRMIRDARRGVQPSGWAELVAKHNVWKAAQEAVAS